ncbi:LysR family transcriptional regulator [Paracoccus sp. MKU1]|uniref:LysR family transcriptional regulator n=1 Tax=Paracoccus sp. MKU1 TaxID=1745182 RepID=UPI000719411B|nr:LysR family transcriptional regulator [Paracoccus sp. MKU1]KRW94663.1 hypothetical protein AQY21_18660 [Paracoccus sp. MKU1]
MKLSTRQIQAFVTIAAQSSFSQAANILGVTQPSLSLLIREMERMLDLSLFDRNTRGVRLSRVGQDLLPIAERILADLRRIEEAAGDFATLSRGEVRVACSAVSAAGPLPVAIRRFERDFPGIRVMIKDTAEQNLADLVRGDHVDFAIATQVETDPRIHQELLHSDQMAAYVAPDQPFAQSETIRWSELGDTPLALLDRNSPLRHIVDRIAGRLGIWLNTRYEVTFGTTALALAEQGLAVAILPSNAIMGRGTPYRVLRKPLSRPIAARNIVLMRLANRTASPAEEAFWQYCRQEIGGHANTDPVASSVEQP